MRDDLEGMPADKPIEWYLARDGYKCGPLSDPEMRKFIELGHLRADDVVWRKGFADWTRADAVFDLAKKG